MAYNVTDILGSLNKYDVLQTNKFVVSMRIPDTLSNLSINNVNLSDIGRLIQVRVEQCRLPGITYMATDVNRYGIGPMQKMPYNVQFTDTSITLIADKNGDLYQFFYAWLNSIFDFSGDETTRGSYLTEYKEKYITELTIEVYDSYGNIVQTFLLKDAFPISFNEIPLSWNQNNELVKLIVGFSFKEWMLKKISASSQPTPPPTTVRTPPQTNISVPPSSRF
jgi:hypothetical protein